MRGRFVATLAAGALLAAPAAAGADTFTVTNNADSGAGSLRQAIIDANTNNNAGDTDQIDFTLPLTGGNEIQAATTLQVTQPVTIDGCSSMPNNVGPCVGLRATSAGFTGVQISSSGVSVKGLAVTGFDIGVLADESAPGAVIRNNWVGLNLSAVNGANAVGILLMGDSAVVGGTTPATRNIVAGNATGLQILGGDDNQVRGNYFGTLPDGSSALANTEEAIKVVGEDMLADDPATGNVIGGTSAAPGGSCDDVCNLISGAPLEAFKPEGIHLGGGDAGEISAGQTTIAGNYIGTGVSGATKLANPVGISIGPATAVTVGGPEAGDRNVITGSFAGLHLIGSDTATIRNNFIGTDATGTAPLGPIVGVDCSLPEPGTLKVLDNVIGVVSGGIGLRLNVVSGATVQGNSFGVGVGGQNIGGGQEGVLIDEFNGPFSGDGNLIGGSGSQGNVIGNTTQAGRGISIIGSDSNVVKGNLIGVTSDGAPAPNPGPGISIVSRVSPGAEPATQNVIGGDTAAEENVISNSGGVGGGPARSAIEITEDASDRNSVLRNRGANNANGFIDLTVAWNSGPGNPLPDTPDGPGTNDPATGPNEGIQPPAFSKAKPSGAYGGGAEPGATVRVFVVDGPAGAQQQGIASFAGSGTAAADGTWVVPFASTVNAGEVVAATQTDPDGNTSELTPGIAVAASVPGAPAIQSGPSGLTADATPTFTFDGGGADAASFECGIDAGPLSACPDGTFTPAQPLPDGIHTFRVVAVDALDNPGPEATREFTVDATVAAPQITAGPTSPTRDSTPTFTFGGEAGASFVCAIDSAAPAPCDDGSFTAAKLDDGRHTFAVSQTDPAGNASAVAVRAFLVDTRAPQTRVTKAPARLLPGTPRAKATFRFRSSERGSRLQCKLDRKPWRTCRSPRTYNLAPGRHVVRIRAIDRAGNRDLSPAVRRVRVATG